MTRWLAGCCYDPAMVRTIQRAVTLICALLAGLFAGCLGDLPRSRSCGDGWWDREHEGCDPSSSSDAFVDACRELGVEQDGVCDPNTCEVMCCGDGVANGSEACDGNDVRGAECPSGSGVVRCSDRCTLDYELCPAVCGDGFVSGSEECEPSVLCGDDDDCRPEQSCYEQLGVCVSKGVFGPDRACQNYATTAHGVAKPYASGNVGACTSLCIFDRSACGFCGDAELDESYKDLTWPHGDFLDSVAEICDIDAAEPDALRAHCEPLCVDEPINADIEIECDFDCMVDCQGFAPPNDIGGGSPEALGCCLTKHSACPLEGAAGVPDLPCCAWLANPDAEPTCVDKQTNSEEKVCP
jgi:hypothetical protein